MTTNFKSSQLPLMILAIIAVFLAGLSLLFDFSASTNLICFLALAVAFLIVQKYLIPSSKDYVSSVASYNEKFNARMKNQDKATVALTFQLPEQQNNSYVRERIRARASSAIADRFSSLSKAPSRAVLRSYVLKAVERDAESLGIRSVEVLIQDIEIQGGQDDDLPGIFMGREE